MKTLKYILSIWMVLTLTAAYAADYRSTSPYLYTTSGNSTRLSSMGASSIGQTSVSFAAQPVSSGSTVSLPMTSTTTFRFGGSTLPMAAVSGVTTADDVHPTRRMSGPRRDPFDPFGGETIDDTSNPDEPGIPVGSGLWLLIMLAIGYGAYYAARRRENTKKNNL